jgi:hypothetical protein
MAEVTYSVGIDDVVAFYRYFHTRSPHARRTIRNARLGIVVGPATALVALWAMAGMPSPNSRLVLAGLLPLVFLIPAILLYPRYLGWCAGRTVRRIYSAGPNPGLTGHHTLRTSPEGLVETSEVGQSCVPWESIGEVVETPEHAFIYLGPGMAHVVPRGTASGSLAEFLVAVRSRVGSPGAD